MSSPTHDEAESLMCLAACIARLSIDRWLMGELKNEARSLRRDFYTHVVSCVLRIDYYDVMTIERNYAKDALFLFSYVATPEELARAMTRGQS